MRQSSPIEHPSIALIVFSYLEVQDVLSLGSCSKYLNELFKSDEVWMELYKRKWQDPPSDSVNFMGWKAAYIEKKQAVEFDWLDSMSIEQIFFGDDELDNIFDQLWGADDMVEIVADDLVEIVDPDFGADDWLDSMSIEQILFGDDELDNILDQLWGADDMVEIVDQDFGADDWLEDFLQFNTKDPIPLEYIQI